VAARYDAIGRTYTATRATDPRIAAQIWAALGGARSVVNVGAGTGSYEPPDHAVTAVEPSAVMIAQRPPGASPAVKAGAEALPFADASFDAAMAVLTLHHWHDWRVGCAELRRGSRACAPTSTAAPGRAATPTCWSATRSTSAIACSSAPAGGRHARAPGTRVRRDLSVPEGGPMPQPKSSRSSSSRASSSRASKPAAASRPAAKRTTTRKPAAKSAAAKRAAAKPAAAAGAGGIEEAVHANLTALRDALRKGVVLTADGVKATLDDAVKRGRITRKDATELSQSLLSSGRSQADSFRSDLEQLLGRGRSQALQSSDRVLREVDRARRRVGVGSSFPITLYDELTAAQIQSRLSDLTAAQLRKVRDYETRNDGRKSVLGAIEKKLA
jgi:polyhydroxyalkanoate synthesis regulator phasin